MRKLKFLPAIGLTFLMAACGTKWALPTANNPSDNTFGAGDTNYIRISPDWSAENGYHFESPRDVIVGRDGYVFVANQSSQSISVFDAAGTPVTTDDYGNDFTA